MVFRCESSTNINEDRSPLHLLIPCKFAPLTFFSYAEYCAPLRGILVAVSWPTVVVYLNPPVFSESLLWVCGFIFRYNLASSENSFVGHMVSVCMQMGNSTGPSTLPCGIPLRLLCIRSDQLEEELFTRTLCRQFNKKISIQFPTKYCCFLISSIIFYMLRNQMLSENPDLQWLYCFHCPWPLSSNP